MCRVELIDPLTVRADVEQRLLEWRSLIQDRKTHALRLLKQLIVGRLELIPNMEERYYGFRGTGTPLPVIAGVAQSVASPLGTGRMRQWNDGSNVPIAGVITSRRNVTAPASR